VCFVSVCVSDTEHRVCMRERERERVCMSKSVCVYCVCQRECVRERERKKERKTHRE